MKLKDDQVVATMVAGASKLDWSSFEDGLSYQDSYHNIWELSDGPNGDWITLYINSHPMMRFSRHAIDPTLDYSAFIADLVERIIEYDR